MFSYSMLMAPISEDTDVELSSKIHDLLLLHPVDVPYTTATTTLMFLYFIVFLITKH